MHTEMLTPEERLTVAGVLRTQAAMQDNRVLEATEIMARLRVEEPDSSDELIREMSDCNDVLESDSSELNRIADKIEQGGN